ncbi:phage tail tape measure protein [Rhizobium sp. IBUN]|uniref:phage tail tape measure protein n=1 Tax=Rhizobium sp. IBUN TaxID=1042326 RepID=UPI0004294E52|nr:phage tail tape measure protein [Rhizobium sp. IBUN]
MSANAEATVTLSLIDRVTGPIKRISARLGSLSKRIGLEKLGQSIGNIAGKFKGLGDGIAATSGRLAGLFGLLGAGGAGVIATAYGLAQSASDAGSEIHDMSVKLGIGTETLSEYLYVSDQAGASAEAFTKGVEKLGINAVEASKGNKQLSAAFRSLGVRVKDSSGKMRPMEDVLDSTFAGLAKIKDPLKRNQLAFKLFGKSGVELTKILADGAEGIKSGREEARRLGVVWSQDAANAADAFGDGVSALGKRLNAFKTFVGVQLLPVIGDAIDGMSDWLNANSGLIRSKLTGWVQRLGGVIRALFDPTSQIRQQFAAFADKVGAVYDKIKPLVDLIGGPLNAALALIGLWALAPAISAVTLLGFAFGGLAKAIAGVGLDLLTRLTGGIADFAGAGLGKTIEAAGGKAGNLWGKAFGIAARVAIIAGIAAIAMEVLEKYDPKGNLGGLTKPVDDYLRDKLGLPAKDTGITPAELWQGTKDRLFGTGDKPEAKTTGAAAPVREKLSPVARDLGFNQSPVFGDMARDLIPTSFARATTDSALGKAKDDAAIARPNMITSNSTSTTTIDASVHVGAITVQGGQGTPREIAAAVDARLKALAQKNAADAKSSLVAE